MMLKRYTRRAECHLTRLPNIVYIGLWLRINNVCVFSSNDLCNRRVSRRLYIQEVSIYVRSLWVHLTSLHPFVVCGFFLFTCSLCSVDSLNATRKQHHPVNAIKTHPVTNGGLRRNGDGIGEARRRRKANSVWEMPRLVFRCQAQAMSKTNM